jgi:hypothetical protein
LPFPTQRTSESSSPCLIKLSHTAPNQSFSERYLQTLREKVVPLLTQTAIRKLGKFERVKIEKKVDKDRPGPGYERSKRGKLASHHSQQHQTLGGNVIQNVLPKESIDGQQEQLIIYVFEPSQLRETDHPHNIFDIQNPEKLNSLLPEEWKRRTTFKFIPASYLSVVRSYTFDQIANEIFQQVIFVI